MSTVSQAKHHIKMIYVVFFVQFIFLIMGSNVYAVPYLQLDANPAIYVDGEEESIVTTSPEFTLYALVNGTWEDNKDVTFYLSAALLPSQDKTDPPPDFGSFTFEILGTIINDTIQVADDMDYGTPPIEIYLENKDLPSHGVFETYYIEYDFKLDSNKTAALYNSQDNPGGLSPSVVDPLLYYQDFAVDISGLAHGYTIHFDLYTTKIIEKQGKLVTVLDEFAPFSHDVTAAPIPGAVLLGLLGMGVAGMKLRKYA